MRLPDKTRAIGISGGDSILESGEGIRTTAATSLVQAFPDALVGQSASYAPKSPGNDATPDLPLGLIPRVDPSRRSLGLVRDNPAVPWIMFDLDYTSRLLERGLDSRFFGPATHVITTTTISDDRLVRLHPAKELDLVTRFKPDWHVPADRPVYLSQNPAERAWFMEAYLRSVGEIRDGLDESGIGIIPLIKGVNPAEWMHSTDSLRSLGALAFSYYSSQYFGHGRGNRRLELANDVATIIAQSNIAYLMVIGLQAPSLIRNLPPQVRAFAGTRWRSQVNVREDSVLLDQISFGEWGIEVNKQRRLRQSVLLDVSEAPGG